MVAPTLAQRNCYSTPRGPVPTSGVVRQRACERAKLELRACDPRSAKHADASAAGAIRTPRHFSTPAQREGRLDEHSGRRRGCAEKTCTDRNRKGAAILAASTSSQTGVRGRRRRADLPLPILCGSVSRRRAAPRKKQVRGQRPSQPHQRSSLLLEQRRRPPLFYAARRSVY